MRIVFDLDGTLVDSLPDIHAAASATLEDMGYLPLDRTTIRSCIGHGVEPWVVDIMRAAGASGARALWVEVFTRHYAGNGSLTRPFDGVVEALAALAPLAHFGLCTNKPYDLTLGVLEDLDLGPFQVVIGGDSLPQKKPHPAPLLAAAHALGDGPVLYVGDSEVDAATAKAAGIDFALFTGGYRKTPAEDLPHRLRFDSFRDLPALVQSIR
ncbi:phosphoglycolate phosphatase [Falsirhodobacter deserti]|uniref:phosphoglycolate phosphatase n=1 Tax=Falsirhodobacter deserti TaxID=1365611 RepID=UPI000FE42E50|nr:phosphoglycolate phosphatase [Falsirhodobacter deserti]